MYRHPEGPFRGR